MQTLLRRTLILGVLGVAVLAFGARADDKKDEKKVDSPSFKQTWEVEVPADTVRIGSADVMGDKKFHLLTLGKDGILTIHDVTGEKPKQVGKVELGKTVDEFVAGSLIKGKPAIIVVDGAFFVRGNDSTYAKTLKSQLNPVNGFIRPAKGAETIMAMGGLTAPKEIHFEEKGDKIELTDNEAPDPTKQKDYYQLATIRLRLPKKELDKAPLPEGMKLGGWNLISGKSGMVTNLLTFFFDAQKQFLCIYDFTQMMGDPSAVKPMWTGPEIKGKILDLVVGNSPKDAKQTGAFVLTESKDDAKKRTVTFFVKE